MSERESWTHGGCCAGRVCVLDGYCSCSCHAAPPSPPSPSDLETCCGCGRLITPEDCFHENCVCPAKQGIVVVCKHPVVPPPPSDKADLPRKRSVLHPDGICCCEEHGCFAKAPMGCNCDAPAAPREEPAPPSDMTATATAKLEALIKAGEKLDELVNGTPPPEPETLDEEKRFTLGCGKSFWPGGVFAVCGLDDMHDGPHVAEPMDEETERLISEAARKFDAVGFVAEGERTLRKLVREVRRPVEQALIDADHEWAQWREKWTATLDTFGNLREADAATLAESERLLSEARKERDEARQAGREYIAKTDPLIGCAAWVPGGEAEKPCGDCRACWISRAEGAEREAEGLAEALRKVVDAQGVDHEEDCPGDDTCGCALVKAVNAALSSWDARRKEGR